MLAGGDDGRIARYDDRDWSTLGTVDDVRAIDRNLVGARDGVYRVVDDSLASVGLDNVRDVSATGRPLVATAEALYYLGPRWATALEGMFSAVDADGQRAYATADGTLYVRTEDEWSEVAIPISTPLADIDHAEQWYAVSVDGRVFAAADHGWQSRSRSLATDDVTALAVRCY